MTPSWLLFLAVAAASAAVVAPAPSSAPLSPRDLEDFLRMEAAMAPGGVDDDIDDDDVDYVESLMSSDRVFKNKKAQDKLGMLLDRVLLEAAQLEDDLLGFEHLRLQQKRHHGSTSVHKRERPVMPTILSSSGVAAAPPPPPMPPMPQFAVVRRRTPKSSGLYSGRRMGFRK